jgi:hypothetical protein
LGEEGAAEERRKGIHGKEAMRESCKWRRKKEVVLLICGNINKKDAVLLSDHDKSLCKQ